MTTDTLKIVCDNCKEQISSLQTQQRKMKRGFFEVGLSCPHCQFWVHSHYSNTELQQAEKILENFKKRAGKSLLYRKRYEAKILEFMGKHKRVQEQVKRWHYPR